ncbi:hypothetical protein SD71_03850 [Cohnella kolymensis]|uniref:Uncharacterized protein n=1 Tax=Cohnella kolymensis TaxID=1590652 RepID=A0ABR5A7R9_9BACL|nr:hypothetical protein [Cohnella kolymensis]KIL37109.1 hypothetical protein SD71_03850 [Cohnella kolymensis]
MKKVLLWVMGLLLSMSGFASAHAGEDYGSRYYPLLVDRCSNPTLRSTSRGFFNAEKRQDSIKLYFTRLKSVIITIPWKIKQP